VPVTHADVGVEFLAELQFSYGPPAAPTRTASSPSRTNAVFADPYRSSDPPRRRRTYRAVAVVSTTRFPWNTALKLTPSLQVYPTVTD